MPRSKAGLLYSPKGLHATGKAAERPGGVSYDAASTTSTVSTGSPTGGSMKKSVSAVEADTNKYGYEDAAPDSSKYGYGDAAPDSAYNNHGHTNADKYGYGSAVPDSHKPNGAAPEADKYGYGDATPDSAKYGYGDATPDSANNSNDKYGYGDATPDISKYQNRPYGHGHPNGHPSDVNRKYLYGDDKAPGHPRQNRVPPGRTVSHRTPRRSSMKQQGAPRRASISYTGQRTTYIPSEHRSVKRRTSISFADNNEVQQIEPVATLTDAPEKLWFQDSEYNAMKQKIRVIVDYVESVDHQSTGKAAHPKVCTRGLERHLEGGQRFLDEKYNARDFVLDEQEMQRDEGMFDEDGISQLYQHLTVDSKSRAYKRGLQDAKDIEQYTAGTRRMITSRRLSMPF